MGTGGWPPSPPPYSQRDVDDHWTHFDNSVNAISFGFVFLVMAIFEKLLLRTVPSPDIEAAPARRTGGGAVNAKLAHPSPKVSMSVREVSVVVMPGDSVPTFLTHPAPVPCPPERCVKWPSHHRRPSDGQCLATYLALAQPAR